MYELYVNKTFDDGIHAYYVNLKKKQSCAWKVETGAFVWTRSNGDNRLNLNDRKGRTRS